jgi:catechol 2,3-dioxygenase-like lactoylglutathione lyase family enzyme
MTKPNGLNHIAISTGDMKKQIEYFSDVLGMELTALYWMHGVANTFHGFLKLGEESVAFVFKEENKKIETVLGQTHSGNAGEASAPGTMQHIAFNVDTFDEVIAMRDRIRSRGIPVMGPMDHGICHSIYFAGLENLSLEISTSHTADAPLDLKGTWIDPEVVGLCGINEEELESYMSRGITGTVYLTRAKGNSLWSEASRSSIE